MALDRLSTRTVTMPEDAAVSSTVWISSSSISRAPSAVSSTALWACAAYNSRQYSRQGVICHSTYSPKLTSFNGLFSRTAQVSRHQKGKTVLDFNEPRADRMAVASAGSYTNQTDNHTSTSSLNFLQVGCSSWCGTNRVKALKAFYQWKSTHNLGVLLPTNEQINKWQENSTIAKSGRSNGDDWPKK